MPTYKLTYFNTKGRAETIRLLFHAGGIKFEDHRIEGQQWPALKPKTPFGTLPILEVDGKEPFGQSMAIARFIAKEAGLYGASNCEAAYIDSIVDMTTDLREKFFPISFYQDAAKKESAYKEAYAKDIPDYLCKIEKFLGAKNFISDKLSFADVHFFSVMGLVLACNEHAFKGHEKAAGLYERVKKYDKIACYLKK